MGSFWPLMRVQVASMELMPVRMKPGDTRGRRGFMAAPFMSRRCGVDLAEGLLGRPVPSKTRPSISPEGDGHGPAHEAGAGALHVYAARALKGPR